MDMSNAILWKYRGYIMDILWIYRMYIVYMYIYRICIYIVDILWIYCRARCDMLVSPASARGVGQGVV